MIEKKELSLLLPDVVAIARAAGDAIMPFFKQLGSDQIQEKADKTPVTQADFAAHQVVKNGLQNLTPKLPIISEEGDCPGFSIRQAWSQYWLVDPLDGTRGFIRHSDEFTVNIALIENGVPVLGVIVQPVHELSYFAIADSDVYQQQGDQTPSLLTQNAKEHDKHRVLCGHFDRSISFVKSVFHDSIAIELIQMNSSIKFIALAKGEGDLYCRYGPTSEWDTAAGQCILQAAGGTVVDLSGDPLHYNAKPSLINPYFLAVRDKNNLPQYLPLIQSLRRKQ